MRKQFTLLAATAVSLVSIGASSRVEAQHINPVVDLLASGKPVFGLYTPANRRVRPGAAALPADSVKTQAQLAAEAVAYKRGDYVFDGSMEGNFDAAYPTFVEFVSGMHAAGMMPAGAKSMSHALFVKTPEIAPDYDKAADRIRRQLNAGAAGIVFVGVESAAEVKRGLEMMRFKSHGGTRPDEVGGAPAFWGLSEKEYKDRADVWPLNPKGELVNFTIVESKEGLAHLDEIAAVKGIGVLFPGAGTLRGVFSTVDADGKRVLDEKGWENSIQQVLAACKKYKVACGYPAGEADIEMRMKQGFSLFVIGWGDSGFKAVEIGRKASGRASQ